MKNSVSIAGIVALCVGVCLLTLGVHKLFDFHRFVEAVNLQGLVGSGLLIVAAVTFVALETLCGLAAIALAVLDHARSSLVICALLFAFTATYSTALVFRPPAKPAPCGCGFSSAIVKDWRPHAAALWVGSGALLAAGAVSCTAGQRALIN